MLQQISYQPPTQEVYDDAIPEDISELAERCAIMSDADIIWRALVLSERGDL